MRKRPLIDYFLWNRQNTEQGTMNLEFCKSEKHTLRLPSLFDLPAMRDRKAKRAGIPYSDLAQQTAISQSG
jgi:hypothetical protein